MGTLSLPFPCDQSRIVTSAGNGDSLAGFGGGVTELWVYLERAGGLELARTRATVTDLGDRLGYVQAYLGLRYLKHMCAKNQIPELSKIWSSFGLWSH